MRVPLSSAVTAYLSGMTYRDFPGQTIARTREQHPSAARAPRVHSDEQGTLRHFESAHRALRKSILIFGPIARPGDVMAVLKRALLISTGDRYLALASNFATIALVSRILTPAEVGVSVIGMAFVGFAMSAREFASANFLIPRQELDRNEVRGTFTVMLSLTLLIAAALAWTAPLLAGIYDENRPGFLSARDFGRPDRRTDRCPYRDTAAARHVVRKGGNHQCVGCRFGGGGDDPFLP